MRAVRFKHDRDHFKLLAKLASSAWGAKDY
jgi:hypothetical protein